MNNDLTEQLKAWPHEPGGIQVRKIFGDDGSEKLQLRLDLGIIQMEMDGRPDGKRPHGFESFLEYHKDRAEKAEIDGKHYTVSGEDAGDLQQESIQYYHRYISLLQIEEYEAVIRDTGRNLELFDFMLEHGENEEIANAFEQFRAYVMMMNVRARALLLLDKNDYATAITLIEKACKELKKLHEKEDGTEEGDVSNELNFLRNWLKELREKKPLSKREQIEKKMQEAIRTEAYEEAARLRDEIRLLDSASN